MSNEEWPWKLERNKVTLVTMALSSAEIIEVPTTLWPLKSPFNL